MNHCMTDVKILPYFRSSFVLTVLGLMAGGILDGMSGVVVVAVLTVLESSMSFDNAVLNAGTLQQMDALWRRRFLVWGLLIAVVGMRLLFPLLIVGVVAGMSPMAVLDMALHDPKRYALTLTSTHHEVAAFGGAFLLMVFMSFFVDANKDRHWLRLVEAPLTRLGGLKAVEVAVTLGVLLVNAATIVDLATRLQFLEAGMVGVISYILADGVGSLLGGHVTNAGAAVAKQGLAGFLYLELLDASFSFDGVIGAFALSDSLFIIGIGLGVGASYVRSFTLLLVDTAATTKYRYLEHGALWAIGALAGIMFLGIHVEVPEVVTGLLGAGFIALALLSSLAANRRDRHSAS